MTEGRKQAMAKSQKNSGRTAGNLAPKQVRFALEYAKDLNGKQAAIRAGYAPQSAEVKASKLLSIAKVRTAVDALLAESAAKAMLSIERTDREIACIAFFDPRKLFHDDGTMKSPSELDADLAAAVASFEVTETSVADGKGKRKRVVQVKRVRFWDKVAALTLAARRLQMLNDTIKLSGTLTLEQLVGAALERKSQKETKS